MSAASCALRGSCRPSSSRKSSSAAGGGGRAPEPRELLAQPGVLAEGRARHVLELRNVGPPLPAEPAALFLNGSDHELRVVVRVEAGGRAVEAARPGVLPGRLGRAAGPRRRGGRGP